MNRSTRSRSPRLRRPLLRLVRYVGVAGIVVLVLVLALYAAGRAYLPTLIAHKAQIEAQLSSAVHYPVRLGRIEMYWRGMNPGVRVYGVTVFSSDARRTSIRIGEAQVSVRPLALLRGRVEVYRIVLIHPSLTVVRDEAGRIGIADLAVSPGAPPGAGFAWLLAQPRVAVRDGELHWRDARDPGGQLTLADVELSLSNSGERHRLAARADFPQALCRECKLTADVTGDPFTAAWDGEVALRASGLDIQAFPQALRERLPQSFRGRFDVDLWSDWRGARPQIIRGRAAAARLRFPFGAKPQTIDVRELSADVLWQARTDGWRLALDHLTLGLVDKPWFAGRLLLEHGKTENLFEIDHLDLDDVTHFIVTNQTQHPMLRHWAELRPSGTLDALHVKTRGTVDAPSGFEVSARLVRVGIAEQERLPSVTGLSGQISFDDRAGELEADSKNFSFYLPRVFRAPLRAARAGALVRWEKTPAAWHVSASSLHVEGEDGKGSGALTLDIPDDRAQSPVLKLRVDFSDGNGAHAARYYPVHKLSPRALHWMESSFVSGRVTSGYLVYAGPIREFPFEDGQGRFELHAQVRDGVYRYLPGWEPLTQVQASVAIDRADAVITGSGYIGALRAHDVRVEVGRAPDARTRAVRVRGQVDGPVAETVRVLQAVETKAAASWRAPVRAIASAAGTGTLNLDVQVPLKSDIGPSFFATYRLHDAALKLDNGTGLEAAQGVVRFTEAGLHDSDMQGQLFGGPTVWRSTYDADGLHMHANGRFLVAQLLRSRPEIAHRVNGGVGWSFDWHDGPEGARLRADADFSAVRTQLPAPLDLGREKEAPRFTVTTEISRPDALVLAIRAAQASSGKLAFDRIRGRWHFDRGSIDFGGSDAALPQRTGLEIGLNADAVDVDKWLALLDRSSSDAALSIVTGVRADVKRLRVLNREWGRSFLHFARYANQWKVVVDGDAAAGEGSVTPARAGRRARLRFDLAYLRFPPRDDEPAAGRPADPHDLPALELRARNLEYKRHQLGELEFIAAPDPQGWRIDRLHLTRPEMRLAVDGVWRQRGTRESSEFNIDWDSDDVGTSLDALGMPEQMSKGKAHVKAHLTWPGAPTEPKLAGLDGSVDVKAENGRFLRFNPGAVRLFNLLDLRSIGRYLTLDFSPAFGKGLAFDAIHGHIGIDRGNARTTDLLVSGPSLSLAVAGRVGLATEDYDLALEASPRLGSTLTLTSWGLFGPQVAAAVLALQRLFKRQIQEGTRVTYLVKGPWDNPTVTKLSKSASAQTAPADPGR